MDEMQEYAYQGHCRGCHKVKELRADMDDRRTAEWLKEVALRGLYIARATLEEARATGLQDCTCE